MKIVSALLGMALVVVTGLAIHLSREVAAGRLQIADLKAQMQERDERIATLMARTVPPIPVPLTVAAPLAIDPSVGTGSSVPAAEPTSTSSVQGLIATMRAQSSSPEAVARRRVTARTLIEGMDPDIQEALGLAPEEADKLLDLLATQQERASELYPLDGSNTMSPAERLAASQARQQQNQAELQSLLGGKYDQWRDYNDTTRGAWQQRRDLRAVLDAGGMPMTDAQSKSLITALSAEYRAITQQRRDAASQGRPASEIMTRYSPERRQQFLDAAAPHLSPQQLEGYRGLLERAAAQERSTLSTLQAIQDRAAAGAAAAPR
jgi:hypothetical protein